MKRITAILIGLAMCVSLLTACQKEAPIDSGAENETAGSESTEEKTDAVKNSARDLGVEAVEQAIIQSAFAYYYRNPYGQYNLFSSTIVDEERICTLEIPPEWTGEDQRYYENCRGYVSDVYYDAFNVTIPGAVGSWHATLNSNWKDKIVLQFGDGNKSGRDDYYTEITKFIEEFKKVGRPGDIILADKEGGDSHVLMYLGDCYNLGSDYVMHCWPVDGGSISASTGENKMEPMGAITLQTANDLLYGTTSSPNWGFPNMKYIWIIRPLASDEFLDCPITDSALSRLKYKYLKIDKKADRFIYNTVLPGEELTIYETLGNMFYDGAIQDLPVKEYIPEGTELVEGSILVDGEANGSASGNEISWTLNIPEEKEIVLQYTVRVTAEAGTEIDFQSGKVADIPTREMKFKVGASRLSEEQTAKISAYQDENLCKALSGGNADIDFVNNFYRNVLGTDAGLPTTAQALLDSVLTVGKSVNDGKTVMLQLKTEAGAELNDAEKALDFMRIRRNTIGNYVTLNDKVNDRTYDFSENYYEIGDVFVKLSDNNMMNVASPKDLTVYIYVGGGYAISYSNGTAKRVSMKTDLGRSCIANVFIGLRPCLSKKMN